MGFPLKDDEIAQHLTQLAYWHRNGSTIEREFHFDDFSDSIKFVNQVAEIAEHADHHPDITINFNRVKLNLTSHDSGGITERDFKLATKINKIQMEGV